MRRWIFTILVSFFSAMAMSQTTYYWVGGTTTSAFTTNANWNTTLGGGGTARSAVATNDVLIFDGSNLGGGATGNLVATVSGTIAFGKLILKNGANVSFSRTSVGNNTITVNGDGNGDDFTIDATSTLTVGGPSYNYDVYIVLAATAKASISGTVYLSPLSTSVHTRSYITSPVAGACVFNSGSAVHITDSITVNGFNNSVANSIVFKSGASLYYYSGKSPLGTSSTNKLVVFEPGSNCFFKKSNLSYVDGTALSSGSGWTNNFVFGNLTVCSGASLFADGSTYKIENFTIESGASFTTHSSGSTPVLGNLTVDGTLSAPSGSSNSLVMGGNTPQSITGTGTITIPQFILANNSDVTLSKEISCLTSATIFGKINFGTNGKLIGAGTFSSRVQSSATTNTGNPVQGSFVISGVPVGTLSGNIGLTISGTGIAPNTNVISTSSGGGIITLSKAATASGTGTSFTFASDSATLATSNPNAFDTLTGSVTLSGAKSFQSGTNYIINAATNTPFGISSPSIVYNPTTTLYDAFYNSSMTYGNVTLNAAVKSNYNSRIRGVLTLGTGNLTIRATDTLRITTATDIAGSPNNTKYIISEVSGTNAGVLRMDNFTTAKTFPIGTATKYMPVTLTPTSAMDFAVSVFPGTTKNGTPDGVAFSTKQKEDLVDAVWTINRINGTGDCTVQLSWDPSLEGSNFSTLASTAIGISRFDATANDWTPFSSTSADNNANTITQTFNTFSPFVVGAIGLALPVTLTSFEASAKNNVVVLSWNTANEVAISQYIIEKSANGVDFSPIGSVNASNAGNYSFSDLNPNNGAGYYRLKMLDFSGTYKFSQVLLVKSTGNLNIGLYPNPVTNSLTVTGLKNKSSIRILNMNGQTVLLKNTNSNIISLDVAGFKAGIYKMQISNETGLLKTVSFVKQ